MGGGNADQQNQLIAKEDRNMANTVKIGKVEFIDNGNGYYYKVEDGKKSRIAKAVYEEAKAEAEAKAEKAPKAKAKRAKKNAAFTATIALADDKIAEVTLTANQVAFLNRIPTAEEFVQGADSTFYTDLYCDAIADIMNAMVVGAMVSTLREKDLIYVAQGKVNGKKCKFFGFTDLGKAILKEMGLV
jgi:hypothetical protein